MTRRLARRLATTTVTLALAGSAAAQEPDSWADPLEFHTFSIAAVDPETGESGAAVTTRVACVGNGVPWVRAGVGAVATQARTRVEYAEELLDMVAGGASAAEAMEKAVAADDQAAFRQVGIVTLEAGTAQHTGSEAKAWAGHRAGKSYVTQGNILVGAQVLEAVATSFEGSDGTGRHLADRLIAALAAGQAVGGDRRKGRTQSAAVIVADPRPGRARRPDGQTVFINVCEHPQPVAELRRIYDGVSQTLGFRTLQQFSGRDVWQLKLVLHALGHFRGDVAKLERGDDAFLFGQEVVEAVDSFRKAEGLSTRENGSPPGLVDAETVERLWTALEGAGRAGEIRKQLADLTAVRR